MLPERNAGAGYQSHPWKINLDEIGCIMTRMASCYLCATLPYKSGRRLFPY